MVRAEHVFQCFYGGKSFISNRLQSSVQVAVLEQSSQITDGAGYVILVIVGWDCKVMRGKGNSVGDFFPPSSRDVCLVTAVVVWAVPNIPSIYTMFSPFFPLLWSFIN